MKKLNNDLVKRAQKIKLIGMDIDGVLTNGDIIVLESGEEIKLWNVHDRMGFYLVRTAVKPLKLAWITGRSSRQVVSRATEVGIDFLSVGSTNKIPAYENLKKRFNLKDSDIAYIGDDFPDLPLLRRVGLSVAPADAPEEIKSHVHYVTKVPGGGGVFREALELVMKSQGIWEETIAKYLR